MKSHLYFTFQVNVLASVVRIHFHHTTVNKTNKKRKWIPLFILKTVSESVNWMLLLFITRIMTSMIYMISLDFLVVARFIVDNV